MELTNVADCRANGVTTLSNCLALMLLLLRIHLSHDHHFISKYLLKRNESKKKKAKKKKDVHSNFILNSEKLKTAKMPISRLMYKQSVVYSYNGILVTIKTFLIYKKTPKLAAVNNGLIRLLFS